MTKSELEQISAEEMERVHTESRNLWAVWAWIKTFGGTLNENRAFLNRRENRRRGEVFSRAEHGDEWLAQAAAWVRGGGK